MNRFFPALPAPSQKNQLFQFPLTEPDRGSSREAQLANAIAKRNLKIWS